MAMIQENLSALRADIMKICQACGRNPEDITLVGVTKFATGEDIREAIQAGLTDIGENKAQVARDKFLTLKDLTARVKKHMIGHLQTNKVKLVLDLFDMIQSVDSLHLAQEIQKQAEKRQHRTDILIQVDCAGEEQKFGVPEQEAMGLIEQVSRMNRIRICGLMTIAPFTEDTEVIRNCFRKAKALYDKAGTEFRPVPHVELRYLSMGMTHDYTIAIQEGSNMLRIGTAIFR